MSKKTDISTAQQSLFKQEVPEMPEGYYSGDRPNPNLRAFVEEHLKEFPYDPETDDYDVPAFDKPIETTKATAIYNMHTYWSKKPHDAIRQYIRHYTKPGDLVLDPFCGSGGTGVACKQLSRNVILGDLSPFCTFLTYNFCCPEDINLIETEFNRILQRLRERYSWIYQAATYNINSFIHSDKIRCIRCFEEVFVYDCKSIGKSKYSCPSCGEEWNSRSSSIQWTGSDVRAILVNKDRKLKQIKLDSSLKKIIDKTQEQVLQEIESLNLPNTPIPKTLIDFGGRLATTGTFRIKDLYSPRTQLLLFHILRMINEDVDQRVKKSLRFIVSACLLNLTLMYQVRTGGGGKPGGGGGYYIPPVRKELSLFNALDGKKRDILKGRNEQLETISVGSDLLITTEECLKMLKRMHTNSIDYIFTDPPYAGTMPYAALNCIWDFWLRYIPDYSNEILGANWRKSMEPICQEIYRILKPNRRISICYHDTSEGTWQDLQDVMALAGFIPEEVDGALGIETSQKSYQQLVGNKVTRRDLIITFRKPRLGELVSQTAITGDEDESTFNEKVCAIIREYLEIQPGSTKDRIYDEVVSRLVRAGQMEAHNFDDLLRQVAEAAETFEHEAERWYLKETELAVADQAETARENAAAENVRVFIEGDLTQNPDQEGVHYSDLFEHYVYSVKDKPRRPLAEWLLDYFYKTETGTYRLPQSKDEERLKAEGRAKGTHRRIKRYLAYLEQGVAVPQHERPNDATLAGWIRHCKRSGLYEQGKFLYEKGGLNLDNLSEEAMVNVEEDYQVCVRMLTRHGGAKGGKKRKKA